MYFYDKNGNYAGAVWIYFSTDIQNNLGWYKNYIPFSLTLSVPVKLIVVIHCNGVEVLNMVLSDSVCTKHSWTTYWEQSNGYVYFYNQDGNQAWIQLRNSGGVRWCEAPPKEPWQGFGCAAPENFWSFSRAIDVDGCFH